MIEKLHSAGLRLLLWQIPVYKQPDKDDPPCIQRDNDRAYAVAHKLCVMDSEGKPYAIPEGHWFAGSLLPDFTNAETRRLLACFSPIMQWHSEPNGGQFAGEEMLDNNERSP
jgi:alpha-glucosidase (family GH31 glycosyl hydrolase)